MKWRVVAPGTVFLKEFEILEAENVRLKAENNELLKWLSRERCKMQTHDDDTGRTWDCGHCPPCRARAKLKELKELKEKK